MQIQIIPSTLYAFKKPKSSWNMNSSSYGLIVRECPCAICISQIQLQYRHSVKKQIKLCSVAACLTSSLWDGFQTLLQSIRLALNNTRAYTRGFLGLLQKKIFWKPPHTQLFSFWERGVVKEFHFFFLFFSPIIAVNLPSYWTYISLCSSRIATVLAIS